MEGIVPLYYEMKKAQGGLLTPDSIYQGMSKAYVFGNIGPISNLITVVHNNSQEDRDEALKAVKWLVMETNFTIDASKTLFFLNRPKYADEIIKKHTKSKLPNFFIYAKDKLPKQVEEPNNSTINRIASKIPDPRLKFNKSIGKFDYRMLMNLNSDFTLAEDNVVINAYDSINLRSVEFTEADANIKGQNLYIFKKIREKIINDSGKDLDYIVNTLVAYLYTVRKTSSKKRLWDCFGDVIVRNLQQNIEGKGKICPICGKRFEPIKSNQIYCSDKCFEEHRKEYSRIKKQENST